MVFNQNGDIQRRAVRVEAKKIRALQNSRSLRAAQRNCEQRNRRTKAFGAHRVLETPHSHRPVADGETPASKLPTKAINALKSTTKKYTKKEKEDLAKVRYEDMLEWKKKRQEIERKQCIARKPYFKTGVVKSGPPTFLNGPDEPSASESTPWKSTKKNSTLKKSGTMLLRNKSTITPHIAKPLRFCAGVTPHQATKTPAFVFGEKRTFGIQPSKRSSRAINKAFKDLGVAPLPITPSAGPSTPHSALLKSSKRQALKKTTKFLPHIGENYNLNPNPEKSLVDNDNAALSPSMIKLKALCEVLQGKNESCTSVESENEHFLITDTNSSSPEPKERELSPEELIHLTEEIKKPEKQELSPNKHALFTVRQELSSHKLALFTVRQEVSPKKLHVPLIAETQKSEEPKLEVLPSLDVVPLVSKDEVETLDSSQNIIDPGICIISNAPEEKNILSDDNQAQTPEEEISPQMNETLTMNAGATPAAIGRRRCTKKSSIATNDYFCCDSPASRLRPRTPCSRSTRISRSAHCDLLSLESISTPRKSGKKCKVSSIRKSKSNAMPSEMLLVLEEDFSHTEPILQKTPSTIVTFKDTSTSSTKTVHQNSPFKTPSALSTTKKTSGTGGRSRVSCLIDLSPWVMKSRGSSSSRKRKQDNNIFSNDLEAMFNEFPISECHNLSANSFLASPQLKHDVKITDQITCDISTTNTSLKENLTPHTEINLLLEPSSGSTKNETPDVSVWSPITEEVKGSDDRIPLGEITAANVGKRRSKRVSVSFAPSVSEEIKPQVKFPVTPIKSNVSATKGAQMPILDTCPEEAHVDADLISWETPPTSIKRPRKKTSLLAANTPLRRSKRIDKNSVI